MADDKNNQLSDRNQGGADPEPKKKPDTEPLPPDDKKVEEDPSEQPS